MAIAWQRRAVHVLPNSQSAARGTRPSSTSPTTPTLQNQRGKRWKNLQRSRSPFYIAWVRHGSWRWFHFGHSWLCCCCEKREGSCCSAVVEFYERSRKRESERHEMAGIVPLPPVRIEKMDTTQGGMWTISLVSPHLITLHQSHPQQHGLPKSRLSASHQTQATSSRNISHSNTGNSRRWHHQ